MTTQTFHLPDLGEGLTEAMLVRWLVAVGDTINVDQAIAEVETEKSIVELPSPYAGEVAALHGEEGSVVLTGAPLVEVLAGPVEAAPTETEPAVATTTGSGSVLVGYGTEAGPAKGRRRRRRGSAPTGTRDANDPTRGSHHTVAVRSPIVRRLARELGIDPRTIAPTGFDGAVTRSDVLRAARLADTRGPLNVLRTEHLSPLRQAVGAKLSRSRAEIPEATVWVDVDLTELWELRPRMASSTSTPPSLTALLARYALIALEQYPVLASRLSASGEELVFFDGVSLGIAVDTDRGLIVPVIHRAHTLSLSALDRELHELTRLAHEGHIPPEQLHDSTFTVNNYGCLGVDGSAAIINHPEVAMLGIGRVLERPWVVGGQIVPRRIAQLSLVFDHRVCDGGYAAGFLGAVVELLEHPLRAYSLV